MPTTHQPRAPTWSRWRRTLAAAGLLFALASFPLSHSAIAQARLPLPVANDSSGVLSAIRAIDVRQLCQCPTVALDTLVRRGPRARMFGVLEQLPAFALSAQDLGRLRLARHRVVATALRTITRAARDTAFMAVQLVQGGSGDRQILVVVSPPNGTTTAYLVMLTRHRDAWRVRTVRNIYEP